MAKIGSPLQIDQRKSVQEPVLLPTTSRIGNNVGALKVDYMPYEIGQENAKAQMAVTNELSNMAFKVAEAYQVTENINRQYKVNLLERDLQENDAVFASEMSEARTYEQKNDVVERYRASITDFGSRYNKIYPSATPKEQRVGLDMQSRSLAKASTYEVQANMAQYSETTSDLKLRLKLNSEEFGTKQSIDPILQLRKGKELLGQLLEIGAMTKTGYDTAFNQYVTDGYINRSKLMGRQFGQDVADGKFAKDMTKESILEHIGALVGIDGNLDPSRSNQVYEAFNIASTTRLRELNTQDTAFERSANTYFREDVLKRKENYKISEDNGTLTQESHDDFISYLYNNRLYGERKKQDLRYSEYQNDKRPITNLVTAWTDSDGLIARAIADGTASGSDYGMYNTATNSYDVDNIVKLMRDQGITHQPTISAVRSFYRDTHTALSKGYNGGAQSGLVIDDEIKRLMFKDVKGDTSMQFKNSWGVTIPEGSPFEYKQYTSNPKGVVNAAQDAFPILQEFETAMTGAIQADISNSASQRRVKDQESIEHLSRYSHQDGKDGRVATPFYTIVDPQTNSHITWEQRTNTPKFREQFKKYVADIAYSVKRNLRPPEYWKASDARIALDEKIKADKKIEDKTINNSFTGSYKKND